MGLPRITDIKELSPSDLDNEILTIKKQLFKLRFCRATKETFKPHEFKHKKHRLAQLLLIKSQLEKQENSLIYM